VSIASHDAPGDRKPRRHKGGKAMEIRHILAPVDFSEYSKKAVAFAFDLAKTFGAKLSLLHVVEPLSFPNIHCTEKSLLIAPIERTLDDITI
jgi:hypothetical protein